MAKKAGHPHRQEMEPIRQGNFRPLIEKRLAEIADELAANKESTDAVSPDKSIGRLSRLDSMQMQQMALASKRRLEDEMTRLRGALRRIDQGRYGRCQLCGKDIAIERLEYQPDAVSCVPCLERRR